MYLFSLSIVCFKHRGYSMASRKMKFYLHKNRTQRDLIPRSMDNINFDNLLSETFLAPPYGWGYHYYVCDFAMDHIFQFSDWLLATIEDRKPIFCSVFSGSRTRVGIVLWFIPNRITGKQGQTLYIWHFRFILHAVQNSFSFNCIF